MGDSNFHFFRAWWHGWPGSVCENHDDIKGGNQRGITRGHKCNGDTFRGKNEGIEGNLKGG